MLTSVCFYSLCASGFNPRTATVGRVIGILVMQHDFLGVLQFYLAGHYYAYIQHPRLLGAGVTDHLLKDAQPKDSVLTPSSPYLFT
jgi:hypothetical protein